MLVSGAKSEGGNRRALFGLAGGGARVLASIEGDLGDRKKGASVYRRDCAAIETRLPDDI